MKYEVLNNNGLDEFNFLEKESFIINNYEIYKNNNLSLNLNSSFFEQSSLLIVIFFDGSLPKREISNITLNNRLLEVTINTNENKFSTMDYRKHTFLVKLDKEKINNITIKK